MFYAKTYSVSFLNSIQQLPYKVWCLKIGIVMKFMTHLTELVLIFNL